MVPDSTSSERISLGRNSIEDREKFNRTFGGHGFKTGFLKLMLLKLISEEPSHGYALMQNIESHTDQDWRPSPGSIYPALQELEKKGLISFESVGRQKVYRITPEGEIVLKQAVSHLKMVLRHMRSVFSDEIL
ncbi:MAG: PadR family transcriptional regulator [Methanomassiliicoccales archaeon]|nr:PadR family transcriptional regulator [Methanomassiliicoccales archaeon]NYT15512.1 PadR family transcriptional regulator [Methanomassiliicoccales archaeon]